MTRRSFFLTTASALAAPARLSSRQRVDRALTGQEVDRVPFTFWYHFGLEKLPGDRHAKATLDFHRKFRTDLVKVMSDYPFPKPPGKWHELRVNTTPFPEQLRALQLIAKGLGGRAHAVETIFNPWNIAEKLSSPADVQALKRDNPTALLEALQAIAESEAAHARKAVGAGASGIFLAIANARPAILAADEYAKFSEPFDKFVLEAVQSAPLNILHLHGDDVYLDRFVSGWPAAAINYSTHGTGISIAEVRGKYPGVLMGGIDERNYRTLAAGDMRLQWHNAQEAAGKRFILAPGCSVPNETTDSEMLALTKLLGA
jgi:uroporphyrinogen decarboxylase